MLAQAAKLVKDQACSKRGVVEARLVPGMRLLMRGAEQLYAPWAQVGQEAMPSRLFPCHAMP